jgi:ABC-type taurine transport system ATPase subunit
MHITRHTSPIGALRGMPSNRAVSTSADEIVQRLALARAYAVKPQYLLMDEPFGALDAQTRSAMRNLLLEVVAAEKTVMLISHSVEEAIRRWPDVARRPSWRL